MNPISLEKYRAPQRMEMWEERRRKCETRHELPEFDMSAFAFITMTFVCGMLVGLSIAMLSGWLS